MIRCCGIALLAALLLACGGGRRSATHNPGGFTVALSDSLLIAGVADTIDFGRVDSGEDLVKRIAFTNPTAKPVVILDAETNCGCIEVDYPRTPLAPGGRAEAVVYFHSGGLHGWQVRPVSFRTSLGPTRYRIVVTADVY